MVAKDHADKVRTQRIEIAPDHGEMPMAASASFGRVVVVSAAIVAQECQQRHAHVQSIGRLAKARDARIAIELRW